MNAVAVRSAPRLPSGVMIYKGKHHETEAWPDLLAWLEYLRVAKKARRTLEAYERGNARLLLNNPEKKFSEFTDLDLLTHLAVVPDLSRHIAKAPLNQWFKWGYKTRRLTWNPADLLPDIRHRRNRNIQLFNAPEEAALRALPHPHGQLMTVLLETGIRNQEARYLTAQRVNFRDQLVLVREGAKGSKERVVPLTAAAAGAFHELLLDGIDPAEHFWGSHPGGKFTAKRLEPIAGSTFARWWRRCLDEAGVEYRKPHTTRHSFATRWLDTDLPETGVQDMLGHESIRTTRDIYEHRNIAKTGDLMREIESSRTVSLTERAGATR